MEIENIIIGGGITGTYLAYNLNIEKKDFYLLELSYKLGGRHLTIKDKKEEVLYEAGAWRVHSSHTRMIELCKKFGLTLNFLKKQKNKNKEKKISGISKFDEIILNNEGDIIKSFKKELETGYQGTYDSASCTNPYSVNTEKGEYYVYSPYNFNSGNVFLVPKDQIIDMGFN